jgi:multidrug resistance efflux pump
MSQEDHNLALQIGELKGQMSALLSTVAMLTNTVNQIDTRLRQAEFDTIKLSVKMGLLGIVAGGLGSFLMSYILKFL